MKRGGAIQNTGWLLAGSIARMLIQLIVGMISARYLGPSNYGILNYVAAYITLFTTICELGLTITIVNEIVNSKDNDGTIVGTAITLRLIAAVISTLSLLLIVSTVDAGDTVIFNVALIRSFTLIFDAFNSINFWYQTKLQSKFAIKYELIAYFISSTYKIAILILQKDIYWFAAATVLDSLFIAIFYLMGFKKHSLQKLRFSRTTAVQLLKLGFPFILSGIMIYIYGQTDRIMIGKMMTQTDVGYYSCAASIATMVGFIPQAIMNSGKTVIMESYKNDRKLYELRTKQTLSAVLWFMNLYALFLVVFGKGFIWLTYGNDYLEATTTLKVIIWSSGLSYVGTIRNVWLICEDKRKYVTIFSTAGAVANIGINFLLIPIYGTVGAAIATVFTQCLTTAIIPLLFKDTRRFSTLLFEALILKGVDILGIVGKCKEIVSGILKKRKA